MADLNLDRLAEKTAVSVGIQSTKPGRVRMIRSALADALAAAQQTGRERALAMLVEWYTPGTDPLLDNLYRELSGDRAVRDGLKETTSDTPIPS